MRFNSLLDLIGFSGKAHGEPPVSGCVTNTRMPETPASSQVNSEPILAIHTPVSAYLGDAPLLLPPWLEGVFFKCSRTVSWDRDSTSPNSTALPARARSVQ